MLNVLSTKGHKKIVGMIDDPGCPDPRDFSTVYVSVEVVKLYAFDRVIF